ncbi:hypothetical protein PC118_g18473 [Phytophthora cactorum]|uniref:Uncharacterized protein n=1 Tax=Phytophthora cactorum TaxID=29920 RepID=A0A8T1FEP5_9STRA|nr:hypothetical protein PC118_g18473 [Phytophthora cactorum]
MAQSHLTDRVSVESIPKPKTSDALSHQSYAELKSPVDPALLENGSLRPANGSVSAYSWENLGMITHIAAVGIVYGTITVTASSVIQSDWANVEPLNSGIASMLTAILTMGGVAQDPYATDGHATEKMTIHVGYFDKLYDHRKRSRREHLLVGVPYLGVSTH